MPKIPLGLRRIAVASHIWSLLNGIERFQLRFDLAKFELALGYNFFKLVKPVDKESRQMDLRFIMIFFSRRL